MSAARPCRLFSLNRTALPAIPCSTAPWPRVFRMELAQSPFVTAAFRRKRPCEADANATQAGRSPDCGARPRGLRAHRQPGCCAWLRGQGRKPLRPDRRSHQLRGWCPALGEASREVSSPEQLPAALAKLAGQIRHDLGESRRTITRFSHPLAAVNNGSLDALKDLTESERLAALGARTGSS